MKNSTKRIPSCDFCRYRCRWSDATCTYYAFGVRHDVWLRMLWTLYVRGKRLRAASV